MTVLGSSAGVLILLLMAMAPVLPHQRRRTAPSPVKEPQTLLAAVVPAQRDRRGAAPVPRGPAVRSS